MRITIIRKFSIGFLLLFISTVANTFWIREAAKQSQSASVNTKSVIQPSIEMLRELQYEVINSHKLVLIWVYVDKKSNTVSKNELLAVHDSVFPSFQARIGQAAEGWSESEKALGRKIVHALDSLEDLHKYVIKPFDSFEVYDPDNAMLVVTSYFEMEEGGGVPELTRHILSMIGDLLGLFEQERSASDEMLLQQVVSLRKRINIGGFLLILFVLFIGLLVSRSVVKPVNNIRGSITQLSHGVLPMSDIPVNNDEIGDIARAVNRLVSTQHKTVTFAMRIGKGDFEAPFEPLSHEDLLGVTLIEMRQNLSNARQLERDRQQESRVANWSSQGLAYLGDMLSESRDVKLISASVLRFIVRYLKAVQGGLYLLDVQVEDSEEYELVASIAFDMQKNQMRRVHAGSGLLGECILARQTLTYDTLPPDYLKVESGSGYTEPSFLVLCPIIVENECYGVIELSFLRKLDDYEVEFVSNCAFRIGYTVSTIRSNERNLELLQQSRRQAVQLSIQEEQLRQNIEELQAIQEELRDANAQLRRNEEMLEETVRIRTQEVVEQKNLIESKNKDITDSITYAKRIQESMLPNLAALRAVLKKSFVLYKPRDIVSGDFYWFYHSGDNLVVVAADCTGHGVPGALMSMLGDSYLNQIVKFGHEYSPSAILAKLHNNIHTALRQKETSNQDGMDMAICSIDMAAGKIRFAGAKNPLVYVRQGQVFHLKGDRNGVGGFQKGELLAFEEHEVVVDSPTMCYIFSDGYQDQFGGADGRKFMISRLREKFLEIHEKTAIQQKDSLNRAFEAWVGSDYRQIDDVLVVGFEVLPAASAAAH